tara:strand:- start:261 stop:497 length:237 start_codon:yes stop_codon:yes gene_type:complete
MAYTRNTASNSGLRGVVFLQSDGKFGWTLKEAFSSDDLTGASTGSGSIFGNAILASGADAADYDTAAAALKTAWDAAG